MKRGTIMIVLGNTLMVASMAWAGFPTAPLTKCPPDAVVAGTVCLDKYEASVWRVPNPTTTNAKLVKKIRRGKATLADLTAAGATQLEFSYEPCASDGQTGCSDIFAVSLPGVIPSRFITWFQAQQACKNSRKRLPSNAEWQAGVAGTPDSVVDVTTDCRISSSPPPEAPVPTGSRSNCVSNDGAFDMVGNLWEWVADWVPLSTGCASWGSFTNDSMCLAGADTTSGPGALVRGGAFDPLSGAGPLAVLGYLLPQSSYGDVGFRCAR
ncbi:MAG: SUMF1/EgtB/PvdO family nonheme iron enzyme [Candidatus Binatia bacterium]|nr:SUMF1/EgtB/PvdO family nonheme iron enzyme [Candidatus Binatia bacterium]